MLRIFIIFTLLSQLCFPQEGSLRFIFSGRQQNVEVHNLDIDIEVVDDLTYTTITADFYNPYRRNQEGEMILPLPDGATVCDYKLDVNGVMKDASVVLKAKALKAYEEIKARNVDPGIVEKKKDEYKIRVFPVLPKKNKRMSISYVTRSKAINGHYNYQLPLQLSNRVHNVSINILAPNSQLISENIQLNTAGETTTFENDNFDDLISLRTLVSKNNTVIVEEQKNTNSTTFYHKIFIPDSIPLQKKHLPENITFLWDSSGYGERDILDKRFNLLDKYFQINQNTSIKLYSAGYELTDLGSFQIKDGDWSKLNAKIQKIQYDGALNYNCVKAIKEEDLNFPLFTFFRSAQYQLLALPQKSSNQHNIDLHKFTARQNLKSITQQKLVPMLEEQNLLGLFDTGAGSKCLQFVCTGLKQDSEIHFGYEHDNQSVYRTKIGKNSKQFSHDKPSVSKSIAQHVLNQLITQNQSESVISNYAIEQGLVSDYTSMIVLETLEDYVKYEIPPNDVNTLASYKTAIKRKKYESNTDKEIRNKNRYHARDFLWHNYPIKIAIHNIDVWKNSIHRFFLKEHYDAKSYQQVISWKSKAKESVDTLQKVSSQKEFVKAANAIVKLDEDRQKLYFIPSQYPKDKKIHVSLRGAVRDPKTHVIEPGTDLKEFILTEDVPYVDVYRNSQRITYNVHSAQYKKTPLQSGDMLVAQIDVLYTKRQSFNIADQPYIIDPGTDISKLYYLGATGGSDPFASSDFFSSGGFSVSDLPEPSKIKGKSQNTALARKNANSQDKQWKAFTKQVNNNSEDAYSHYLTLRSHTKRDTHFYLKVADILYKKKLHKQARKVLSNIMAGEESSTVAQKRYLLWLKHFADYQYAISFIKEIDPKLANSDFRFIQLTLLHQLEKLSKNEIKTLSNGLNHSFDIAHLAEKPMYDLRVLATAESNGVSKFINIKYVPAEGTDLQLPKLSKHGLYSDIKDGIEEHTMKQAIPGTYKIELSNKIIATYGIEIHSKQHDDKTTKEIITVHTDGSGGWKEIGSCNFTLP